MAYVFGPHGSWRGGAGVADTSTEAQMPVDVAVQTLVTWASGLRAQPGDRLVISGHELGEVKRDAEVLEAR